MVYSGVNPKTTYIADKHVMYMLFIILLWNKGDSLL